MLPIVCSQMYCIYIHKIRPFNMCTTTQYIQNVYWHIYKCYIFDCRIN